jgi:hypothetical protein
MRGAIAYNESKVVKGDADLIHASKFGLAIDKLTSHQMLQRFNSLFRLNPRVKTNTVHISLNFDPSERHENIKLIEICRAYMDKLGFGHQPYLIYRHDDAAHPHVHIVTTNIQSNGRRIDLHNIGRIRSETARKEVEIEFGLVKAEGRRNQKQTRKEPVSTATYGRTETKKGIANVVKGVIRDYKFTSFAELNAVLNHFNVAADRGNENTEMFKKNGLVYSLLKDGRRVGVPIKASSIDRQVTYQFLVEHFKLNKVTRKPFAASTTSRVKTALEKSNASIARFEDLLRQADITAAWAINKDGQAFGITFIDHKHKVVFKGSDLGKELAVSKILVQLSSTSLNSKADTSLRDRTIKDQGVLNIPALTTGKGIIESLLTPLDNNAGTGPITKNRKRKRKNRKSI